VGRKGGEGGGREGVGGGRGRENWKSLMADNQVFLSWPCSPRKCSFY
jgi:hypothetical protein